MLEQRHGINYRRAVFFLLLLSLSLSLKQTDTKDEKSSTSLISFILVQVFIYTHEIRA